MRTRLVALLVALALGLGLGLWALGRAHRAPPPPAPRLPPAVDARAIRAGLGLLSEEYAESAEQPGELARRRPAMERLIDALEARTAQGGTSPAATELLAQLRGLRTRLAAPGVDYDWKRSCLALAAWVEAHGRTDEAPAERPSLERGEQVYRAACAPCHGVDALGRKDLHSRMDRFPTDLVHPESNWRPVDMFDRISYGGLETAMPSFVESLSAQQRWDVVFYLFAKRWWPCNRSLPANQHLPAVSATDLARASDFDLTNRYGYNAVPCLRRSFVFP